MKPLSFAEFVGSLFKSEVRVEYVNESVRAAEDRVRYLEETITNPPSESFANKKEAAAFVKDIEKELEEAKAELAALEESLGPAARVPFLFRKLTADEHGLCEELASKETTAAIERYKKEDPDRKEIDSIRTLLDPDGIFSADVLSASTPEGAEIAEKREGAILEIVKQILIAEGMSESWATEIDDDDPDMELTEAEEDLLAIDEARPHDEQVKATLERETEKRKILDEKRARLIEERTAKREKRIEELKRKGFEVLVETLYNYKILSKASHAGTNRYRDLTIFYSVRDPNRPIQRTIDGETVTEGCERYFSSIEAVAHVREQYETFYRWMTNVYGELQRVRTKEDVERVSRSAMFLYDL